MRNRYFLTAFFLFFLLSFQVNAESLSKECKYSSEYEECLKSQSSWTNWPRGITEFVCISSRNNWKIMAQIILDKEFKKIDKKIDSYLSFLEKNKDYYFWEKQQEPFLKAIDDMWKKFSMEWEYWKEYLKFCRPDEENSVLQQTLWCFWWVISADTWKDFFMETDCKKLVATKLEVSKQVANDILKLNKLQVKKDSSKKFMQKQRTKYDKLLEIMMINIGYIERIWKKWPSKTKDAFWK